MPQLQEGDEIVHINGRIVKEMPHQEVRNLSLLISLLSLAFIFAIILCLFLQFVFHNTRVTAAAYSKRGKT